ncbi:hypothetical protein [Pontibacter ruber]|uniref:Outer membrane protein beta-barrel domain-containing protein n=1 Tax=Pontibacter ruber TaxID=1343895 RepID=A0ABW5D1E0_9BACT|nr:hypothetical protein [Pontibacter ruber]
MRKLTYLPLYLLLLLSPFFVRAQEQATNKKIILGASVNTGLSYTGFGITAGVSARRHNLELVLGPKLSFTETYRLTTGPWGAAASLYFYPSIKNTRLQSFANLDLQTLIRNPYCPDSNCDDNFSYTHEYTVGYGLSYGLNRNLSLFNAINVGFYHESLYNASLRNRMHVRGLNTMVKLGLTYRFHGKENL